MIRWRTSKDPAVPPRAVCSWHDLDELSLALHFIQAYIEDLPPPGSITARTGALLNAATESRTLKRKAEGAAAVIARDNATASTATSGLLTPLHSHLSSSRSPSLSSLDVPPSESDGQPGQPGWLDITVYNGILQKKEGRIFTKKPKFGKVTNINASKLPTEEMREHAAVTPGPIAAAERLIRWAAGRNGKCLHERARSHGGMACPSKRSSRRLSALCSSQWPSPPLPLSAATHRPDQRTRFLRVARPPLTPISRGSRSASP